MAEEFCLEQYTPLWWLSLQSTSRSTNCGSFQKWKFLSEFLQALILTSIHTYLQLPQGNSIWTLVWYSRLIKPLALRRHSIDIGQRQRGLVQKYRLLPMFCFEVIAYKHSLRPEDIISSVISSAHQNTLNNIQSLQSRRCPTRCTYCDAETRTILNTLTAWNSTRTC